MSGNEYKVSSNSRQGDESFYVIFLALFDQAGM